MSTTTKKTKLDSILKHVRDRGFTLTLNKQSCQEIVETGLRSKNLPLALVTSQIALKEQPLTLRGLLYRVVSSGWLPSTDRPHYTRVGRIMTTLREDGVIPFSWIVDNVRSTEKPSSWSGLQDFGETVREAYRKDFWAELPDYVHVICEKDAIAGVLAPVTRKYDVRLSPIRGYVSLTFAHEIANTWNRIKKPVHAYYLGDFDPSGFDLERDIRDKLDRYCERPFTWARLAVNADDFAPFNLIPLKPKSSDRRYKKFIAQYGTECAELDALPATELRRRVEEAILAHVDAAKWERLQEVEKLEKETILSVLDKWPA